MAAMYALEAYAEKRAGSTPASCTGNFVTFIHCVTFLKAWFAGFPWPIKSSYGLVA